MGERARHGREGAGGERGDAAGSACGERGAECAGSAKGGGHAHFHSLVHAAARGGQRPQEQLIGHMLADDGAQLGEDVRREGAVRHGGRARAGWTSTARAHAHRAAADAAHNCSARALGAGC
jgi:hypothetical protein